MVGEKKKSRFKTINDHELHFLYFSRKKNTVAKTAQGANLSCGVQVLLKHWRRENQPLLPPQHPSPLQSRKVTLLYTINSLAREERVEKRP